MVFFPDSSVLPSHHACTTDYSVSDGSWMNRRHALGWRRRRLSNIRYPSPVVARGTCFCATSVVRCSGWSSECDVCGVSTVSRALQERERDKCSVNMRINKSQNGETMQFRYWGLVLILRNQEAGSCLKMLILDYRRRRESKMDKIQNKERCTFKKFFIILFLNSSSSIYI